MDYICITSEDKHIADLGVVFLFIPWDLRLVAFLEVTKLESLYALC